MSTALQGAREIRDAAVSRVVEVAPFAPVGGLFTYKIEGDRAQQSLQGCRVLVPFGRRSVVGVVVRDATVRDKPELPSRAQAGEVAGREESGQQLKAVTEVLDSRPVLSAEMVEYLVWAAAYYYAFPGELIRAALPSALHYKEKQLLRLTAEGREVLRANDAALRRADQVARPEELELLHYLAKGRGVGRRTPAKGALLRRLLTRGWVEQHVRRHAPASPKSDRVVTVLKDEVPGDLYRRAPRQAALLEQLIAAGPRVQLGLVAGRPKDAKTLLDRIAGKGLVEVQPVVVARDAYAAEPLPEDTNHQLTDEQRPALAVLIAAARERQFAAFLMHGVTGSGKTEVYLRLIAYVIERGRSALVLVPEIALTPQLAGRFRARFGRGVAVLHSGLSDAERYEQWRRIRDGDVAIVVGARSAVFAPLEQLGVVIVDEEHDASFKQHEGVRYSARDLALVRAKRVNAIAVLGSATPSMETYRGVEDGRVRLLEMKRRATPKPLPSVEIIDLRVYRTARESALSAPLGAAIAETLEKGKQVILFLNRRGFSTFVVCRDCGHAFRCAHCSVSLTLHKQGERLVCHYCGFSVASPTQCAQCGSAQIGRMGFGTEKVEHELKERFPQARVARLDRDTAGGKGLREVLGRVQRHEVDVLVGTQMVTKGHDFPHVVLVGVLCADLGLHFADFRASERAFQLLTQVAGRAGRGAEKGQVMIQTYSPGHPAIRAAKDHDYLSFYAEEIRARREVEYPPCCQLAAVHFDGANEEKVRRAANQIAGAVSQAVGRLPVKVLGPAEAPIQRIKGKTRWMMLLKAPERGSLRHVLDQLWVVRRRADSPLGSGSVRMSIDVDPIQML